VNLLFGAFLPRAVGETDRVAPRKPGAGPNADDLIKFSGPAYANVDNRLMSLQLVSQD